MEEENYIEVAKAIVVDVYKDAASPTVKQIGLIFEEIAKTLHLIAAPIQITAALQDRFAQHLKKTIAKVPIEALISPPEEILSPVVERLRLYSPESNVAEMFQRLLATSMDGRNASKAHPAFVNIISQLAPDEASLIRALSLLPVRPYIRIGLSNEDYYSPAEAELSQLLTMASFDETAVKRFEDALIKPSDLNRPELFLTYIDHLNSLGILDYVDSRHPRRILMSFDDVRD